MISDLLREFIESADAQVVGQPYHGSPKEIIERTFGVEYRGLRVTGKFGEGLASKVPWIGFLSYEQAISKGIYPVFLYFKDQGLLILAYGVSEINSPDRVWAGIEGRETIREYFLAHGLGTPWRYGSSFVQNVYHPKQGLEESQIQDDLDQVVDTFNSIFTSEPSSEQDKKLDTSGELKEQVALYEVKTTAHPNAIKLFSPDRKYFYWNDTKYVALATGDYVFVVDVHHPFVLFSKLDAVDIATGTEDGRTTLLDLGTTFQVTGEFDKFIRLEVLLELTPPPDWKWKTLGANELVYLNGPRANPESAANRVLNIEQLKSLSDDPQFQEVLNKCFSNFAERISKAKQVSENMPTPITFLGDEQLDVGALEAIRISFTDAGLRVDQIVLLRMLASMLSKRFLLATGLSGSGKTRLAQALARWFVPSTDSNEYYAVIPVGADWTGNDNIVGYPDGLDGGSYVTKPALELIRNASLPSNRNIPHFLILDEMNLSHVERYFADLLSAIESGEDIPLYEGTNRLAGNRIVPTKLHLPKNLFVIGTVNVDETTYMFSPKVLDRANVIEFRMEREDLDAFLTRPKTTNFASIDGKGVVYAKALVESASDETFAVPDVAKVEFKNEMIRFFDLLKEHGAEFGYRTGLEASRFICFYKLLGGYADDNTEWLNRAIDAVIVQKFMPKLQGSRSKLEGLLWAMAWTCGAERVDFDGLGFDEQIKEASKAEDESKYGPESLLKKINASGKEPRYPLSFDKVMRMYRKLVRDQFVSFSEA